MIDSVTACACVTHCQPAVPFFSAADKRNRDREHVLDRREDADRKVEGQVKNGGSERRAGHPAERP